MKRLLLLAILAMAGCVPPAVDIPATAAVAIRLTDAALPTNTAVITATPAKTSTPAPSPTASLGVGATQVRPADGMTMMYVPEGEFTMGYNQGKFNEVPEHLVYLDAFWIDKTEITIGMYAACVATENCPKFGNMPPSMEVPVINATWDQANAYCSYMGARLPTEAEWEKAARGTDGRLYPWGMDLDKLMLTPFNGEGTLPPVGSVPDGSSPYGVLDMAGSAFEWVADWYSPTYYSVSPRDNPTGPTTGSVHVIRGGWWEWYGGSSAFGEANSVYRSTYRNGTGAYGRRTTMGRNFFPGAGFRCARGSSELSSPPT